ncbi:undecaprenyldiphospho-muramoylpentapeptide beta-N-acetylglucosaminyltransferase [Paraferrimonas sp. SM1919]|uniref:undecaprenyldiphospho-muramoylpentapeptide beta-N-acetylglucosaminyltransferase n=1 Tax=Paraferrimonas sp. SM1919 TaxID=2662263 RepID=UPI0013D2A7F7|nr:undecaprenyldiphospho-muramoylpentapeptide beta-N-acetylglucosaminyltransferase [Paraferrimonas sp. SM1919]
MSKQRKLLVMAGGTGGHVFPALAVAKELAQQGWQIHWLGTPKRMEAQLVPQHGIDISFIDVEGVRGNGLLRLLKSPFKIWQAIRQAKKVIAQQQPDVALGMGGFASGPGGVAAKMMGLPLIIHEQNATAGLTNKLLAKIANVNLCAFNQALVNAQVVGNPVRQEMQPVTTEKTHAGIRLLVVGGSLGAQVLNEQVPQAVALIHNDVELHIWHQTGKGKKDKVEQAYQYPDNVKVVEFIDDMAEAYQWADIVICRSGALTVSELAAVGLPSILVPYPHAVDDHQTKNGQYLVDAGGAKLMPQSQLSPEGLAAMVLELAIDEQLQHMSAAALSCARYDATAVVAQKCLELAQQYEGTSHV